MKLLYVTTVGSTMDFFRELVAGLISEGHTVDIASGEALRPVPDHFRELGCRVYPLSLSRSPLAAGNLRAIRELRRIVRAEQYDIVHCHTPVAALCTRLACRGVRKRGTRVFYTAHGFHFYKGAPKKNWLLFYPLEKLCARMTDVLITINHEDYALAQRKLHAVRTVYVPGVGVETARFRDVEIDRAEKRRALGVPEGATLLLSVGELNENKNHSTVLRAMAAWNEPNAFYLIAGVGALRNDLEQLADRLGLGSRVRLLGYRNDVAELYKAADVLVFPSFREGLPVSVMEAMASSLPTVAAVNRGTRELIEDGVNGLLCPPDDPIALRDALVRLCGDPALRQSFAAAGMQKAASYDLAVVIREMRRLYGLPTEEATE